MVHAAKWRHISLPAGLIGVRRLSHQKSARTFTPLTAVIANHLILNSISKPINQKPPKSDRSSPISTGIGGIRCRFGWSWHQDWVTDGRGGGNASTTPQCLGWYRDLLDKLRGQGVVEPASSAYGEHVLSFQQWHKRCPHCL